MSDPIITNCLNCGYKEIAIGGKCLNCGYRHVFNFTARTIGMEDIDAQAFIPEHAACMSCSVWDSIAQKIGKTARTKRTVELTEKQSGKRFVIHCESYVQKHWKAV